MSSIPTSSPTTSAPKAPVTLNIKGLSAPKRDVTWFQMKFEQAIDPDGQVAAVPRGGKIKIKMKALNDGNSDLLCWMIDKKQTHSGSIEFLNTTDGKLMKSYVFTDAYCVEYEEQWEDPTRNNDLSHWEQITISCRTITNSGAMDFKNNWELVE